MVYIDGKLVALIWFAVGGLAKKFCLCQRDYFGGLLVCQGQEEGVLKHALEGRSVLSPSAPAALVPQNAEAISLGVGKPFQGASSSHALPLGTFIFSLSSPGQGRLYKVVSVMLHVRTATTSPISPMVDDRFFSQGGDCASCAGFMVRWSLGSKDNTALTFVSLLSYPSLMLTQSPAQAGKKLSSDTWRNALLFLLSLQRTRIPPWIQSTIASCLFYIVAVKHTQWFATWPKAGLKKQHLAHLGPRDVKYVGYFLSNASLKASSMVIASFACVWMVPWYMISFRTFL